MELKILAPTEEGFVKEIKWNNEEIKAEVQEKVKMYTSLVYTDKEIKEAKADRANLKKFITALEDKRKDVKKQCLAPYEEFEKQIKEVVAIVEEPVSLIDKQIKGYEQEQKEVKKNYVQNLFNNAGFPDYVKFENVFNTKWLNTSYSNKNIIGDIQAILEKIKADNETIKSLPEFSFEASEMYKKTLDLNTAIAKAKEMQEIAKAKQEAEARRIEEQVKKVESDITPPVKEDELPGQVSFADAESFNAIVEEAQVEAVNKEWVSFKAFLSREEALKLNSFFKDNKIEFKAI